MKPFLRLRMAIKRNAKFDSDDVKEGVLNLIDSLESDVSGLAEGDEVLSFSSFTEDCTTALYKDLLNYEKNRDDPQTDEDDED